MSVLGVGTAVSMSVGQRAFVCTDGAAKWTNIDIALVAQRCGLCETPCAKVAVASTHYKCSRSSYIRTNPRLFPLCYFPPRQNTLQQKDVTHATGGTKKGSYHNNGGETGSLCVSHVLRAIWVLPIHSAMQADRMGEMEEKMVIKRGSKSSNNTHTKKTFAFLSSAPKITPNVHEHTHIQCILSHRFTLFCNCTITRSAPLAGFRFRSRLVHTPLEAIWKNRNTKKTGLA